MHSLYTTLGANRPVQTVGRRHLHGYMMYTTLKHKKYKLKISSLLFQTRVRQPQNAWISITCTKMNKHIDRGLQLSVSCKMYAAYYNKTQSHNFHFLIIDVTYMADFLAF